jgi:hypothetical protein
MQDPATGPLIARCVVCKGNIHADQPYEQWEGGYYCERHSVRYLRERAREYGRILMSESGTDPLHRA